MNTKPDSAGGAAGGVLGRLVMVRAGEWPAVLLAGAYFFCLLMSYYLVRPVREAVGIDRGYDNLPWLMTGTMAAMAAINPLFAWLVSRTKRRVFVPLVYRFFAANLVVFFALFEWGIASAWLGYAFYIWLSVFNLFVVSIYWGLLGDLFGPERARRLFGIAAVGGTVGAIAGSAATGFLSAHVGPGVLMLLSACVLEAAVWCAWGLMRRFGIAGGTGRLAGAAAAEPGPGVLEGLKKVAVSPYLQLIAVYVFLYATTSTFLYIEQGRIVEALFKTRAERTQAFAQVDLWTNVLTLTVQVLLTGRVIRWLGLRGTLMVLPLLTAAGFAALWAQPVFATLVVLQVVRRGIHYAVDRPARETLYAVLDADAKYKSKPFIDTFVYRSGDLVGAWVPGLLVKAVLPLAMVAVPVSLAWAVVAMALGGWRREAGERPRMDADERG